MKKKILLILLLLITLAIPVGGDLVAHAQDPSITDEGFMFDLRSITHEDIRQDRFIDQGFNYVFTRIITILAATIGSAAVFMIVLGGFLILTSGGTQERIDRGKAIVKKSILGLVIALGAYVLVTTVQFLINSIYG